MTVIFKAPAEQAGSHGVAWDGNGVANATPGQRDTIFLPPLTIFLQFFIAALPL